MPTVRRQKINAWSWSRLYTYRQCPAKAKYQFIDKLPEPQNSAMDRGNKIHTMAQEIVMCLRDDIPEELETFSDEFKFVASLTAKEAEKEAAFSKNWEATEWFSPEAWVRIKMDIVYAQSGELHVVDVKTGKEYPYHEEQLSLYALGGMLIYPEAKKIHSELWYSDLGKLKTEEYDTNEVEAIKAAWSEKVAQMMNDYLFTPTPGSHCGFCSYSKFRGGPCIY